MPHVMILGGGGFGRWLGHEGGALMNGISALIRDPREFSSPFCCVRTRREVFNPEEGLHQKPTMLAPWSQTSSLQNCEK